MLRGIKQLGKGITYVGLGGVFVMLVVGTLAIDLVLLAYLAKQTKNMHGNQGSAFLTGMLWGMMFSRGSSRGFYGDVGISLLLSPITTAIAVVLSFCLGVPFVAIGLGLAWAGVAAVVGLGLAIYAAADAIEQHMNRPHYGAAAYAYHGVDTAPRPVGNPGHDDQMSPQQPAVPEFVVAEQQIFFGQAPSHIHQEHHAEPTAPAYFEQNNNVQVNVVNVLPVQPPAYYVPTMFGSQATAPVNDANGSEPPPAYEQKFAGNGL